MDSIRYFFGRVLGGFIDRLSDQMRYRITDVAESKMRETVEKSFNQSVTTNQPNQSANTKHQIDSQDWNTKFWLRVCHFLWRIYRLKSDSKCSKKDGYKIILIYKN